jgi:hypothetical protein
MEMSIIRLSLVKNRLFAPTSLGTLEDIDYDPSAGLEHGFLESSTPVTGSRRSRAAAVQKETLLDNYLRSAVSGVASGLSPAAPVTVMVNGFLFDPRVAVTRDPKHTDNPHGRIFHFSPGDAAQEIRHHTTGWPLHLGFQQSDDGDNGLAVAFGWYSQPGHAKSLISHGQNFYARAYAWDALPPGRCSASCGCCPTFFPLKVDPSTSFVTAWDQSSSSVRSRSLQSTSFVCSKTLGG